MTDSSMSSAQVGMNLDRRYKYFGFDQTIEIIAEGNTKVPQVPHGRSNLQAILNTIVLLKYGRRSPQSM